MHNIPADRELMIYIDDTYMGLVYASPGLLAELVQGLLYSYCQRNHVLSVKEEGGVVYAYTSEGTTTQKIMECPRTSRSLDLATALTLLTLLEEVEHGGGGHLCLAVTEDDDIAVVRDVSRHSAVYKAVGIAAKRGAKLKAVAVTGRVSGDMVRAIAMTGSPLLASLRRPLGTGVEWATRLGVTIISRRPEGVVFYGAKPRL